jgi:hypothetical protein
MQINKSTEIKSQTEPTMPAGAGLAAEYENEVAQFANRSPYEMSQIRSRNSNNFGGRSGDLYRRIERAPI